MNPPSTSFWQGKRVLVTGASGFVGRNLAPLLRETGCVLLTPARREYDLLEQEQVRRLLADTKPQLVFHLAGLVGGIQANKERPADFCYQNLIMGAFMIEESRRARVEKYVALMGGCSYPADAASPIGESQLWKGYPQEESAPYALAKAMSVPLARSYRQQYDFNAIVLVPGNLYGPHDNFDLTQAHVVPALIRRFHEAKVEGRREVVVWGTGRAVRDFVYVEDACRVIVTAAETHEGVDIINISSGVPTRIRDLVQLIVELTGYRGEVRWDATRPEGQLEKGFDVTRMREWLECECPTPLREGLARTIRWFEANVHEARLQAPA